MDLDVGFGPTKRRYDHRVKISLRWSSIWEPVWLDDLFSGNDPTFWKLWESTSRQFKERSVCW